MEEIKAGLPEEPDILTEDTDADGQGSAADAVKTVGKPEHEAAADTAEIPEIAAEDMAEITDHVTAENMVEIPENVTPGETIKIPDQAEDEGEVSEADTSDAEDLGNTQVYTGISSEAGDTPAPLSASGDGEDASAAAAQPDDGEDAPDLTTEVSVDDLEQKINASTVITTGEDAKQAEAAAENVPSDDEDKPRKKKKPIVLTFVLLALLAAIIAGAYFLMYSYFSNHFYSGTYINGNDVSGMTVAEVKQMISDEIGTYTLTIKGKDGMTAVLTSDDVGREYEDDNKVDELMENQEAKKWFLSITKSKAYNFTAGVKYDKEKTIASLEALDFLQPENIVKSEDAYLTETPEGAVITPEVEGNEVQIDKLETGVLKALNKGETEFDMTSPDLYIHPQVLASDENLNRRMEDWNAMINLEISYSFGDNVEPVDKAKLAAALRDDGENVTIDTSWVNELVAGWGAKYDTFGKERQFRTHSGNMVTIPAYTKGTGEKDPKTKEELTHTSDYGWLLDQQATADDLISAINDKMSGSRQPVFKYSALGWDNGDLTGSYVEVSLTEQRLWVYQNGQVVVDTPVVTGKPTAERATYPGCYAIDAKKSPATLGTVATQGYAQDVTYWVPFDGGRGLHDASWRDSFGGSIYQDNGSHGCVNCPADVMEKIYNAVTIGEAVVVY